MEVLTYLLIVRHGGTIEWDEQVLTVYPIGTSVSNLKDNQEGTVEVDVLKCKVDVPTEGIRFKDEWDYVDWALEAEEKFWN